MDPGNVDNPWRNSAKTVVVRTLVWLVYAHLNAIVPCLLGQDQMWYREDWPSGSAWAGILTVAVIMLAADLLIIGRLRKRQEIRRVINLVMLILASTQLIPILQLVCGSIAIGIVGLDINGLKVFYAFTPIGADWNLETKVYAMTVITGLLLAVPFTAYATLRTILKPDPPPPTMAPSPPGPEPA